MLEQYNKSALTFEQQLDQLITRGMTVRDRALALRALSSISYYRLSGYWYPFRERDNSGNITSNLASGTTFDHVLELYEFDRNLRLLVMDAIERLGVTVRTRITYHMAHRYGAFAHTNPENFHPNFNHASWLRKLNDETSRSSDEFIRHYKSRYKGFPEIPIWMVTEVMSLGGLSFFYQGLRNNQKEGVEDKKAIADHFNIHYKQLGDWLHTLTYIRNVCAHHSRLWNRELAIRPNTRANQNWMPPITPRNDRIFYILLVLRHLLRATGNGDEWQIAMSHLLEPITNSDRNRTAMGIPKHWRKHPAWV